MPFPDELITFEGQNKLIFDELSYDNEALRKEHEELSSCLICEQRSVYNEIMMCD